LVAISNSKWVGKELYEKGGMTKERLLEFLEKKTNAEKKPRKRSIQKYNWN
jgi:hypothetical protein